MTFPRLVGVALAAAIAATTPAAAQTLLERLFGPREPAPQRQQPAPAPAQPAVDPNATGTGLIDELATEEVFRLPTQRTYCVRTCDGYYFAIGFASNEATIASHREMCAASCGGAEMRLYTSLMAVDKAAAGNTGPAIEKAVSPEGQLYTALPTAYAFQQASNPACLCGNTSTGLPQIPLDADPTLRDGDVVVMADGLKVFRGKPGPVHSPEDFESIASTKALPGVVRDQLMSLEGRIAP